MLPSGPIADRFDVERVVASGGMGVVYRAKDRRTGQPVALKLVSVSGSADVERFLREAASLAELRHPHVVSYVAHGRTEEGLPYLAMEWIEGETLAARLARGRLEPAEAVLLLCRVAEALGEAHRRGLVHRDLKPSNLVLPEGNVGSVKVIDFGVVRRTWEAGPTMTGAVVGTWQYMAPEQARGERDVGPAADVFACGCVLYECLTGRPPFQADDPLAARAKILLEGALDLEDAGPLPAGLVDALRAMLAKDPARRPADGDALARRLAEVERTAAHSAETVADTPGRTPRAAAPTDSGGLGSAERSLVCVLVAGRPRTAVGSSPETDRLRAAASRWATRLEALPEGPVVAVLSGEEAATDLATKAARCALALAEVAPEAPVALVSGRAVLSGRAPLGEVIDRAIAFLREGAAGVRVDDVTAALLDPRFEVAARPDGRRLVREREAGEGVRTVLGRRTPCVGRDAELATLAAVFRQCTIEPVARAALVLGPPGAGKTRLWRELGTQLGASQAFETIVASGDPLRAGSPFALLAPAIRRAAHTLDGDSAERRRDKLLDHVRSRLPEPAASRVAIFLGEISGIAFADDADLAAARRDPVLFAEEVRQAFVDWLGAHAADRPVLVVLEDLHWGDAPSIDLVAAALDRLSDRPIFVLALARPDVKKTFPDLWGGRDLVEIRLGGLAPRASARLVRAALPEAEETAIDRIVAQGAGNPYYLEELCRAEAQGALGASPAPVLAMIQARLDSLAPEVRRVLRAASVFGTTFRPEGIAALLDRSVEGEAVGPSLRTLEMREVVVRRAEADDEMFEFRHALVQEAAYATLTDDDRALGHRLAARFLEARGETDAAVLAEHLERGGDREGAVSAWTRAADQALEGTDLASALARTERGLALGASGEALGVLRVIHAELLRWSGEHARALDRALEAMRLLPRGSKRWWIAAREAAGGAGRVGREAELLALEREISATTSGPAPARIDAMTTLGRQLILVGQAPLARAIATLCEDGARGDDVATSQLSLLRAALARHAGDPASQVEHTRAALASAESAGDVRSVCANLGNLGYALTSSGALEEAEEVLRRSLALATGRGLKPLAANALSNLGLVLGLRGAFPEARELLLRATEIFDRQGDWALGSASHAYLARVLRHAGDLDEAAAQARMAAERTLPESSIHALARAELARALVALGRVEEAERVIDEVFARPPDSFDSADVPAHVARVLVLRAVGRMDEARATARATKERVLARAARIPDEARRRAFLERVTEHAEAMALADSF